MTLEEARGHIGDAVVYQSHPAARREDGTIVEVTNATVFVRYGHNDTSIQATPPEMLSLLCP